MKNPLPGQRIAVVSSGARHVKRGIETWALDLSAALNELHVDVLLLVGSGPNKEKYEKTVSCMPRKGKWNRFITKWCPRFLWRFHLTSEYALEQLTFAISLVISRKLKGVSIVHTQDPVVASVLEGFRKYKFLKAKTLLAHGTEEPPQVLQKYDYLQHLAPFHMDEALHFKRPDSFWVALPNFVNTDLFAPRESFRIREELNISEDALVFLCVAAIKKRHKRIDYLFEEFAEYQNKSSVNAHLIVAGASNSDTPPLWERACKLSPKKIHFLTDRERTDMPDIFNAANVFVMTSLKEMMPIALLEAIASGLPALVSTHPVVTWMRGDCGESVDMETSGALSEALDRWSDTERIKVSGTLARRHAISLYSKEAVTQNLLTLYRDIGE